MKKKRKNKKNRIMNSVLTLLILILIVVVAYTLYPKEKNVSLSTTNISIEKKDEPTQKPQPKRMSLVMVGDALIHGAVYIDARTSNGKYDFSKMFPSIENKIKKYDLKITHNNH